MSDRLKIILQILFLALSVSLVVAFLFISNRMVKSLEQEEKNKVEIWATAYRQLLLAQDDTDVSVELKVMESNTTIPVFYTDPSGQLLGFNNLEIPADTAAFIAQKIRTLTASGHYFDIDIADGFTQRLYYDESILLQQLHSYPYVQMMVIIVFILLLYYMLLSRRRSEQNRVWVGLSKETAHQLGTPIQSLMGWMEYLKSLNDDDDVQRAETQGNQAPAEDVLTDAVTEMDKDVKRLRVVADRFSKIGSVPKLEETDLVPLIEGVTDYMQKRASRHIRIAAVVPAEPVVRKASGPLLSWVIENLCKNAIDAQPTRIEVRLWADGVIEVEDNGKGVPKNKQKKIFQAGYTTKTRGWGLGLALVKRIIEQYHHGRIYVKSSVVGEGTVFRIEMGERI